MGPAASHRVDQKQHVTEKLDQLVEQVEEIEKALQKQKEVKDMYKMRLEKTQVFLKYCLQVAQDNGFLELIVNKDKDEDLSLSPTTPTHSTTLTPQLSPSPPQFHPHLAPLIRQAKINGWYIDPQEVHFVTLPSS
ncbi:UNVERIFIED_CONTAM: hypothetical protein Sradi_5034700 [Sesamum radiatum]|uniref:Uncharacterized protein n=1 Tax=Sesamum radiatum TaxID=300843 RepID=A0AAW2MGB4_SESRA